MSLSTKTVSRTAMFTVAAFILAIGVSACNTIEGAGQDIKSGGSAIEKTADKNK